MNQLRKEFFTILLIIFTEVLGWSLILPFLPYLATDLGASPFMVGFIIASFALCQFISSPIIGKLSDKYGRKPLLLISQFSTVVGFTLLGLANSLFIVLLSRVIDGLLGSNMTLSRAYLGDIIRNEDHKTQTKLFGYMSTVFGLGFFIGPAMGGYLATIDYSIPSFLAAGISIITLFMVFFLLEETVTNNKGLNISFNDIIPVKDLIISFSNKRFRLILFYFFAFVLSFSLITANLGLFSEYQLQVGPEAVGIYLMFVGLIRILFQLSIFPKLVNVLSREKLLISGQILLILAFSQIAFIKSGIFMFVIMGMFSLGAGTIRPTLTSEISIRTDLTNRGKVMGVADSLQSISQVLAPLIGGFIIERVFPGSLGILSFLILFPSIIVSVFLFLNKKKIITVEELPSSLPD
ncbi:MFS transporter [Candidatus Hodarchaeum mangrovi]